MAQYNESSPSSLVDGVFLEVKSNSESQIERCVRGLYVPRNFVVFKMQNDYEVRLNPMQVRSFGNNFVNQNGLDLGRYSHYFGPQINVKRLEIRIPETVIKSIIESCFNGELTDAENLVKYVYQNAELFVQGIIK